MEARPTASSYLYYLLIEFVVLGIYLGVVVPELGEALALGATQKRAFLLASAITAFVAWLVSFGLIGLLLQGQSSRFQRTILALLVTLAALAAGTWVGYTISSSMPVAEATATRPVSFASSTPVTASHTPGSILTPDVTHTTTPEPATASASGSAPTFTYGPAPTWTAVPAGSTIRAVAKGTLGARDRHGLWVIIDEDPYARFLPFEELGSETPSWERGFSNCQEAGDILAVAASGWQGGIVAVLSDEELCVVGQSLLWSIPTSKLVPAQHQFQDMALLGDLVLVGTDFGLFQYSLTDLAGNEVRISDDDTLVPYAVTALGTESQGVCVGTLHYLSSEPYQVWYSSDSRSWTLVEFSEALPAPVLGVWCDGMNKSIAILNDGRWLSVGTDLPTNVSALGKIVEDVFDQEGDLFAALVFDQEPNLFWNSCQPVGWCSVPYLPPSCKQINSLVIWRDEEKAVLIAVCDKGIYHLAEDVWFSLTLPDYQQESH